MGVKIKVFLLGFVFLVICMAANLPHWIVSSVPTAEVIMPVAVTHTPTIICSGRLEAKNVKEKYTAQPLMIEEVYVQAGDRVTEGDVLAKVDMAISADFMSVQTQKSKPTDQQMEYYMELAKQYGLEEEAKQYIAQQTTGEKIENVQPLEQYIKAETSGQLLSFLPKEGQLLDAGSQIYSIQAGQNYQAVLEVSEANIPQIYPGDKVVITGEGLGEHQYSAIVRSIAPSAIQVFSGLEPKTIVEVTAEFCAEDEMLRPGLSVQGQIAVSDTTTMVSVPYEAISQDENNREYVYQLIDGNAAKRYIQVENELSDYVQVANGLERSAPVFLQNERSIDNKKYRIVYLEDWHE